MAMLLWKCTCPITKPGEYAAIVGSDPALGKWDSKRSIKLQTTSEAWPAWWSHEASIIPQGDVSFKYIVVRPSGYVIWEPFVGNRKISVQDNDCIVVDGTWGTPESTCAKKNDFDQATLQPLPINIHDSSAIQLPNTTRIKRSAFIISNNIPISDRYNFFGSIGTGTWGAVRLAEEKTTRTKRAIKQIPRCYVDDIGRLRQEIDIMKSLDHPNIVRLVETFEDKSDVYLVMEYCSGGELFDRLSTDGSFSEAEAACMMHQILSAIAYCHSKRIAHRDLKPENFLFSCETKDSPLKLTDFGLSTRFSKGVPMRTRAGTPYYVSPQVLEGRYGPECDAWSAGVIMYILLCGYPPFNGQNDRAIMHRVRLGNYTFPDREWHNISPQAKNLISKLLDRCPQRRLTAAQSLEDPWFSLYKPYCDIPTPLDIDVLSKFRRFQGLSRLKRLALTVIAQHLDDKEISGLKAVFSKLDSRKDGVLTSDEIRQGIENCRIRLPIDHALDDILRVIDIAGTGVVDYTEFLAACLHKSHYIREEACKAAFRVLDINGSGRIRKEDLQKIFEMAGDTDVDVLAELNEADADGDGGIDFGEFYDLMRRVPSLSLVTEDSVLMMRKTASRGPVSPIDGN